MYRYIRCRNSISGGNEKQNKRVIRLVYIVYVYGALRGHRYTLKYVVEEQKERFHYKTYNCPPETLAIS